MAPHLDEADNQLVAGIRLVLAISALLVAIVDHTGPNKANSFELIILSCYAAACALACAGRLEWARGKLMHRVDVAACAAMAAAGDDADVFALVFLFFAIVVASLRFGLDEGARVTLAGVVLYSAAVILTHGGSVPARLFLLAAILLAFGRAIAQLGERQLRAVRRQALLAELNHVANPRFGIDRTMSMAMERTRAFFEAGTCIVILEEQDSGRATMRAVREGSAAVAPMEDIDAGLARALLPEPRAHVLLYARPSCRWPHAAAVSQSHAGVGAWAAHDEAPLRELADLLQARSFISAPLVFGRCRGRIYLTGGARDFGRGDALFLARIAARELAAIDRIDVLDRIATDAAALERKKIALDLHDTAIQSYIGLQLGLAALCRQAEPSNPLAGELDKLSTMAAEVVVELRDYARRTRAGPGADEPMCMSALRRQAAHAQAAYGVDVRIESQGRIEFGDRLTAEVLQIVREGISNVCRHTKARRAVVSLCCGHDRLRIEISNEHGGKPPAPFRPASITERALALGGSAFVHEGRFNDTIVCVEIPL
ncbi:histidine kinase [Massilia agilis]|uniref:histidine kinase n=1 Tax=Massilia agilis TaxID=1811226 RepID=A0ABT2D795_9BURK|nr:histidine kinase [Massilia agilis]MCS0807008.1 histidine kinase [Massilia agilis]